MSESANQRGEILEDFISLNNLFVCNIGNKFTYDCATGKSIIDITLVSNLLVDRVNPIPVRAGPLWPVPP